MAQSRSVVSQQPSHCVFFAPIASGGNFSATELPIDVAIICAVDVERDSIRRHLFDLGPEAWEKVKVPNDGSWDMTEVRIGEHRASLRIALGKARYMGLAAAASITTTAMHLFRPSYVVMAGIAAGRLGKTKIGDVIVADRVTDVGEGRWEDNDGKMTFRPRPIQKELSPEVFEWVESAKIDRAFGSRVRQAWLDLDRSNQGYKEPDIVLGPTVSGAAVIDSSDFWERMISDKKVVGLDMEAYGLATVVALHEQRPRYVPTWIVAKAVCDHGVEKTRLINLMPRFAAPNLLNTLSVIS